MNYINSVRFALVAFSVIMLAGCPSPGPDDNVFPPDQDPSIMIFSPDKNYGLNYRGETVSVTFRMDDNEQLEYFQVLHSWESVYGQVYQFDNAILEPTKAISGNTRMETVSYEIPLNTIQHYTKIFIDAIVIDNKGKSDTSRYIINVIPDPGVVWSQFEIQEYPDSDTIWSLLNPSYENHFSFKLHTNDVPAAPDRDISEVSVAPNFEAILQATNQPGIDSLFVLTNSGMFNYDSLTYETVWQAFVTSNQIGMTAGPLNIGDIVIMSMYEKPHFAIMHIQEINTAMGFIRFRYKYSY